MPTIERTLSDIGKGIAPPIDLLVELAAEEDTPFLIELATGLENPTLGEQGLRAWVFDNIERVVTLTPSRACTEAAVILLQMPRTHTQPQFGLEQTYRQRRAAEWLATAQEVQSLVDVLSNHQDPASSIEGLIDPLVHELIIREIEHSIIHTHVERQYAAGHPLGALTPTLLPLEKGVTDSLPTYTVEGHSSRGINWQPFGEGRSAAPIPLTLETLADTTTEAQMTRITRAVEGVIMHSNGNGIATHFELEPALPEEPGAAEALLMQLDVGFLRSGGKTSVPRVFEGLFEAASGGGAYGGEQYGAYGRLRAWESLAGLSGLQAPASIDDIQQQALAAEWVTWSAEWFHSVSIWELGLLCIHPERTSCAILAVTDTD